jgi:hypothetical protein
MTRYPKSGRGRRWTVIELKAMGPVSSQTCHGALLLSNREPVARGSVVLREPERAERLRTSGFELATGDARAVTALIRGDLKRCTEVVARTRVPRE